MYFSFFFLFFNFYNFLIFFIKKELRTRNEYACELEEEKEFKNPYVIVKEPSLSTLQFINQWHCRWSRWSGELFQNKNTSGVESLGIYSTLTFSDLERPKSVVPKSTAVSSTIFGMIAVLASRSRSHKLKVQTIS